jgi:hypothetical protein
MIRKVHVAVMAISSFCLSGCYSFQGPERLIAKDATPSTLKYADTKMFVDDFNNAKNFRIADPDKVNPLVYPMMRSGFMYNYTFCENYFQQMVQVQRKSQIARSAIAPITALITGLIGLGNFAKDPDEKEDLVQALAVGSATTTAILNIYDQHFLFGSDNIGAVKTMVLKAQSAHAAKSLAQQGVSFELAMQHLIDNQAQCSPDSILSLARSVIKDAKLEATTQTASGPALAGDSSPGKVTISPQ